MLLALTILLTAFSTSYATVWSNFTQIFLTTAAKEIGAACLDGTVPDIYFRAGFVDEDTGDDGTTKYQVYFQGGGWCSGYVTAPSPSFDSCLHRSKYSLGSSKGDAPTMENNGGFFSPKKSTNPVAYNWNQVYVRYCDGASYSGDATDPVPVVDGGVTTYLYFRGYRNVIGLTDLLINDYKMGLATDILVLGSSAGALGAYIHGDYIINRVKAVSPNLKLYGTMPDSGFFIQYESESCHYQSGMEWIFWNQNVTGAMNDDCIAYYNGIGGVDATSNCIFAQNMAGFVKNGLFPLQSRFDSWQLNNILGTTTNDDLVNEYGANLTDIFSKTVLAMNQNGAFLDSCYHHCGQWNQIIIDGMTGSQAEYKWFTGDDASQRLWFQEDAYPCSTCCNQGEPVEQFNDRQFFPRFHP